MRTSHARRHALQPPKTGERRYTRTSIDVSGALASGSYGAVYLAVDTTTQQLVAIKRQELPDKAAENELLEHTTWLRFPHPNLISMLDWYVKNSALFLVLPLCDTSVHFLFKFQAPLRADRVVPIAQQLTAGIRHMHRHLVLHGDLSMKNVLMDRDGIVRVGDFGSAHSAHGNLVAEERATPYCRSPERWLGSPTLEAPADLWAIGVIILALLAGDLPWFSAAEVDSWWKAIAPFNLFGPVRLRAAPGPPRHACSPKRPYCFVPVRQCPVRPVTASRRSHGSDGGVAAGEFRSGAGGRGAGPGPPGRVVQTGTGLRGRRANLRASHGDGLAGSFVAATMERRQKH